MSVNEKSVVNAGLALTIGTPYSVFAIVMGVWGHSIVPTNCENSDVRYGLRGILVSGFVSLSAFVCYGLCNITCDIKDPEPLPYWFLFFVASLSIANLALSYQSLSGFESDSICRTSNYSVFKQILSYFIGTTFIIMFLSFTVLGYRGYKHIKNLNESSKAKEAIEMKELKNQENKEEKDKELKNLEELEKQANQSSELVRIRQRAANARDLKKRSDDTLANIKKKEDKDKEEESSSSFTTNNISRNVFDSDYGGGFRPSSNYDPRIPFRS
jgi:hypothetical protein